jgi:hypothetical protein
MRIACPVCKAETKVSGLITFKCTACGRQFSKPAPRGAKDAPIFIMTGAMAAFVGAAALGLGPSGWLHELAPFIGLLGAAAFLKGVFQKLFADKTDLVVQEEEKGHVVAEHTVVDLDR